MANNLDWNNAVASASTVDFESLSILQHLVGDEFASVIWRYLSDSENYIQQMAHAFKNSHLADLHEVAHTFKGSSGTLSANHLYGLCDEIERATLANPNHRLLAQLLNSVDTEFNKVKDDLLKYLEASTELTLP